MQVEPYSQLFSCLCTSVAIATLSTTAAADLTAKFIEGAPKDRFEVRNESDCALTDANVLIDLSTSTAGLIFDVTERGAGVEVYQPLEMVDGLARLSKVPNVEDGQSSIRLEVSELRPGEAITFTIDVDDTLGSRAITVSGAEIAGASFSVVQGGTSSSSSFSENAEATLAFTNCET